MRNVILAALTSFACICATASAQISGAGEEGQFPVARIPNSAEQGKVDRPLREKYKTEFASRDAEARGALARKLRDAADAEKDPIVKFVYLREARDLAVDAGDVSYSMEIIDDLARSFPINVLEMKATALAAGIDRSRLPPADLAQSYLKFSDQSLAAWDTDLAAKAAYLAMKLAAHNPPLLEEAKKRDKLAKLRRHEVLAAIAAQQKLARNPDDPDANQVLGRHICFNTGHWDVGLPFLAKSASGTLKEIAQKELANPADAAQMAALADAWWNVDDPRADLPAGAAHRRSAYWYAKALPSLSGEKKAEAEKRIAEVNAAAEP